jgi:flagellar basal-body rod protein FlgB
MSAIDAVIAKALELSSRSEAVIANDVANWETPGFHAQSLSWQAAFARALPRGPQAVAAVKGRLVAMPGATRPDGASTSLSVLMANLAQAQLLYGLAAQGWQIRQNAVQQAAQGVP